MAETFTIITGTTPSLRFHVLDRATGLPVSLVGGTAWFRLGATTWDSVTNADKFDMTFALNGYYDFSFDAADTELGTGILEWWSHVRLASGKEYEPSQGNALIVEGGINPA